MNTKDFTNITTNNSGNTAPGLDLQTAEQLLSNVLSACDMQPNSIPLDVLESWGNYQKPSFTWQKKVAYVILVLLILLPLLFFKPQIIANRTDVTAANAATYEIEIQTLLPVSSVTAALDETPIALTASDSRHYTAKLTQNGTFEITAVAFNGQVVKRSYTVSHLDTEKPEFIDSYSQNGYVYVLVEDTYSGIDYENIDGLEPEDYDEDTGLITFRVPKKAKKITIPDKAGNSITLLLSPAN